MSAPRSKVLSIYKALQRTRENVFADDEHALNFIRVKIKEEFDKFKAVTDPTEIQHLIKVAQDSEEILRKKVIQAKEVRPKVFQFRSEHLREKCTNVRERCDDCTCGQ